MTEGRQMTTAEKKAWLERGLKIDRQIKAWEQEKEQAYQDMIRVTAIFSQAKVQSSAKNTEEERRAKALDAISVYDELIDEHLARLYAIKTEIDQAVTSVDDERYRTLLTLRYSQCKKFEQIAVDMDYAFRWVMTLHEEALEKVIIKNHINS